MASDGGISTGVDGMASGEGEMASLPRKVGEGDAADGGSGSLAVSGWLFLPCRPKAIPPMAAAAATPPAIHACARPERSPGARSTTGSIYGLVDWLGSDVS